MLALARNQKAPEDFFGVAYHSDGTAFNLTEEGRPFFVINLRQMSEEEAELINSSKIESVYWSEGGFWLGVLKMGEMLQQLAFDPMQHFRGYGDFSPDLFSENRLATFVGIDAESKIIRALRVATYPHQFRVSLYQAFQDFQPREDYTEVYSQLIWKFDQLPLSTLWKNFTPSGYFGEKLPRNIT
jgi:hypothetical protein